VDTKNGILLLKFEYFDAGYILLRMAFLLEKDTSRRLWIHFLRGQQHEKRRMEDAVVEFSRSIVTKVFFPCYILKHTTTFKKN
jgi:hypothetical protein